MKILVLNPLIGLDDPLVATLRQNGCSVLLAISPLQAFQMLKFHGESVEFAIVHREDENGRGEPGMEFVASVKEDSLQKNLTILLTTAVWSEPEWLVHQTGPLGANAYLKYPASSESILSLMSQVLDQPLPFADPIIVEVRVAPQFSDLDVQLEPSIEATTGGDTTDLVGVTASPYILSPVNEDLEVSSLEVAPPPSAPPAIQEPELEDATSLFDALDTSTSTLFRLEAPELTPQEQEQIELEKVKAQKQEEELAAAAASAVVVPVQEPAEDPVPAADPVPATEIPAEPQDDALESLIRKAEGKIKTQIAEGTLQTEDQLIAQEMPYLSQKPQQEGTSEMGQPLGDAVVPGGAAVSPDLETLKKYLLLREQDVAALSSQLKVVKGQLAKAEELIKKERSGATESLHQLDEAKKRLADFENEKRIALEGLQSELGEIRFVAKTKSDKVRMLEIQIKESSEEMNRLKERVRVDIRKIRIREKELENRLEIIKGDSEVLIGARENKIIELKRKLDLIEFNMDLLQDQYSREKEISASLREKLNRALQAVRVAGGLLDPTDVKESKNSPELGTKAAS